MTLFKLLRELVKVDPLKGILIDQDLSKPDTQLLVAQFLPIRRTVDGKAVHVDLRSKKRQHFHVLDVYELVRKTLKAPTASSLLSNSTKQDWTFFINWNCKMDVHHISQFQSNYIYL